MRSSATIWPRLAVSARLQLRFGLRHPTLQLAALELGLELADRDAVRLDLLVDLRAQARARLGASGLQASDRSLVASDLALQPALLALKRADLALQAAQVPLDPADLSLQRSDLTLNPADLALQRADLALDLTDLAIRRDHAERVGEPGARRVVHGPWLAVQPPLVARRSRAWR